MICLIIRGDDVESGEISNSFTDETSNIAGRPRRRAATRSKAMWNTLNEEGLIHVCGSVMVRLSLANSCAPECREI